MPTEIRVAPPFITMSQGTDFMVTHPNATIDDTSSTGLYASDTRFISHYHLFINRQAWLPVNSNQLTFYAARYHLTPATITPDETETALTTQERRPASDQKVALSAILVEYLPSACAAPSRGPVPAPYRPSLQSMPDSSM
jgi:hypothetical protein